MGPSMSPHIPHVKQGPQGTPHNLWRVLGRAGHILQWATFLHGKAEAREGKIEQAHLVQMKPLWNLFCPMFGWCQGSWGLHCCLFGGAQRWLGPRALKKKGWKDRSGEKVTFRRKGGAKSSDHRPWIFKCFPSSSGEGIYTAHVFEDVAHRVIAKCIRRPKHAMQVPQWFWVHLICGKYMRGCLWISYQISVYRVFMLNP